MKRSRWIKAGLAILAVLLFLAVPTYTKAIQHTKETLLKQNLFTLRTVIDEYTKDKKAAPQRLEDLVAGGYLRSLPVDPITGSDKTWKVVRSAEGVWDVRSGSDKANREGTPYREW